MFGCWWFRRVAPASPPVPADRRKGASGAGSTEAGAGAPEGAGVAVRARAETRGESRMPDPAPQDSAPQDGQAGASPAQVLPPPRPAAGARPPTATAAGAQ